MSVRGVYGDATEWKKMCESWWKYVIERVGRKDGDRRVGASYTSDENDRRRFETRMRNDRT